MNGVGVAIMLYMNGECKCKCSRDAGRCWLCNSKVRE